MGFLGLATKKDIELAVLKDRLRRANGRVKAISMTDPTLAKIFNWRVEGQEQTVSDPYSQVPIVYACVRARALNLAQVPIDVFKADTELEDHPVLTLLRRPNPKTTGRQLIEGIVTSLDLRGNAYVLEDEVVRQGWPVYLWLVNPKNIELAYDKNTGAHIGWWLTRQSQERQFIEPERMIHFKYFNPEDDSEGLSPLAVARMTYETEWDAIRYNRNFFKNDATPGLAYTHPNRLPEDVREVLEKKYIDRRKGVEHAHGAVLLEGGLDAKVIGLAQKDMQFLEQRKFSREEIMMIYKVPKAEVELYEDMNYATAQSADLSFWKKTLIPLGRQIEAVLTRELLEPTGFRCEFDFMAVDALNDEMLTKVEAATKLVNIGYPINMVNRRLRLGMDEVGWGDEPRQMPTSLALLGKKPEAQKAAPEPGEQDHPLARLDKAMLTKRWSDLMEPLLPVIGKAGAQLRGYFHHVKQRIMGQFAKRVGGAWVVEKSDWHEIDERAIRDAFSDEELQKALEPYLKRALELGIASVLGTPFRIDSPAALALLREKLIKVLECNRTGGDMVVEKLRATLAECIAEGLGNEQTAERIFAALGDSMENLQSRARTIARTEVNGAFSQSRYQSIAETEPKYLRWISSRDSKVRDTHQELDGRYVEFGKAFYTIGGNAIRYPLDPDAEPGETINCRCTMEPIYFDEEIDQ